MAMIMNTTNIVWKLVCVLYKLAIRVKVRFYFAAIVPLHTQKTVHYSVYV